MDCRVLFPVLGLCICLLSLLASQTSGSEGVLTAHKPLTSEKSLLLELRELQAVKAQAEKEREFNKTGRIQDATVADSASLDAKLAAGTDHDNAVTNDATPGDKELPAGTGHDKELPAGTVHDNIDTNGTKSADEDTQSSIPAPPSVHKNEIPMPGIDTDVTKLAPKVDDSDDRFKDNATVVEPNYQQTVKDCGESHCEDPKKLISACLSIPGDRPYKLSLFITYEGDTSVLVKVTAPEFLIADPLEVSVSKGKSEAIQITMDSNHKMDSKDMLNKTIVVTSIHGDCEIEVPMDYLYDERAPYLPSVEPRVIAYLLIFVLVVSCVGAWLCYKCRGKKRDGDVKYQQLEMNGAGQSTPKERVEEAWDEVWDDDWEDTEAAKSSSRLSQSLSSRGLAARRGAKDVWDNSWED